MSNTIQTPLVEKTQLNDNAVLLTFDYQDRSEFTTYKAGQYLRIGIEINGKHEQRAYSISNYPNAPQILVKRVDGGTVSNHIIDHLKVGDMVEVSIPIGEFVIDKQSSHSYFAIAAGSGITPILSHLSDALQSGAKAQLYYINRDQSAALLTDRIEQLQEQYGEQFTLIAHHTSADARPDAQQILSHSQSGDDVLFCVPYALQQDLLTESKNKGVADSQVHTEVFFAPSSEDQTPEFSATSVAATLTVDEYGDEHTIEVEANQNLLDAMLKNDIDISYGCKGGVCGSCKCILEEGEVQMANHTALFDDEIEEGYILPCQSVAKTPTVAISME